MRAKKRFSFPLSTLTGIVVAAIILGGCINASQTNPDNPSTTVEEPDGGASAIPDPTNPAIPAVGFSALSGKNEHVCLIKSGDKSLWCWGANDVSQLGVNSKADSSIFNRIARDSDWLAVSTGYNHTCAIEDFTEEDPNNAASFLRFKRLYCWGGNALGQLGVGTTITQATIFDVEPDFEWTQVSPGNKHTCAIQLDGSLWCWGDNSNSQLGHVTADNTRASQIDLNTDWKLVASSDQFTCGIRTIANDDDRRIYCWGLNDKYQLGDGSTTLRSAPTEISSTNTLNTDWKQISLGKIHGCALKNSSGALYCWGDNTYGQLGDGSTNTSPVPIQINNTDGGEIVSWLAAAAGQHHTCAIANTNELYCWGNNGAGQLGINSTAHQAKPVKISHPTGWIDVNAGASHTCAIDQNYDVHCWGLNSRGQLANGATISTVQPTRFDNSTNWAFIASGKQHSCGLKGSGPSYALYCGGINDFGQLGIGSTSNQSKPILVTASDGGTRITAWKSVAVGLDHTCAIAVNGADRPLFCWGRNSQGQLSDNVNLANVTTHWSPTKISIGNDNWTAIVAGRNHTCGRKGSDELWCWGDNSSGQIGIGGASSGDIRTPYKIPGSWISVAVGGYAPQGGHTCAVESSGELSCWGDNTSSQIGVGAPSANITTITRLRSNADPEAPLVYENDWLAVKAGDKHSCAIKSNSQLWCWGDHSQGQLGTRTQDSTIPKRVVRLLSWSDFALGSKHTCGIENNLNLWCWGDNSTTQLTSSANSGGIDEPKLISGTGNWAAITAGQTHSCAIRETASDTRYVFCWGKNAMFQFGNDSVWKTVPQKLSLQ